MFDTLSLYCPLPLADAVGVALQTKSFDDPFMRIYEIDEDGCLLVKAKRNGEELWDAVLFTGTVFAFGDIPSGWVEFRLRLENGVITDIGIEDYERNQS